MTPYLLRNCGGYDSALRKASLMMANRGFDLLNGEPQPGERERASDYVRQAVDYFIGWLFPFVRNQLRALARLDTPQRDLYEKSIGSIESLERTLTEKSFSDLVGEDPRHLFLLSSSVKYPNLFRGYKGGLDTVPPEWQKAGCAILKMCHLIKAIEEDSQDINDYAQLGIFLESQGKSLIDLFDFDWNAPDPIPDDENARRAFVRLSMFFHKLKESVACDGKTGGLVFDSGDGVRVPMAAVKARLKSPESMFAKLGKDAEEEAYNIRDILAITFLLQDREDALTLFHALQKRGVILQENTVSTSITQTLFKTPSEMEEAIRRLMQNLSYSGGSQEVPTIDEVRANAVEFFNALNVNAVKNPHSANQHRKFQCKIIFSLPIHREAETLRILVPGTVDYAARDRKKIVTQQHTLPVELRISDRRSWEESEQTGEAHHDAYKCRQLISLMNRLFDPSFRFPQDAEAQLRKDQDMLFS